MFFRPGRVSPVCPVSPGPDHIIPVLCPCLLYVLLALVFRKKRLQINYY
jgi:hypothetical protein